MWCVHSFTLNIRLCSPHRRCIQRQCWIDLDQCLKQVCSKCYFVKQSFSFSFLFFKCQCIFCILQCWRYKGRDKIIGVQFTPRRLYSWSTPIRREAWIFLMHSEFLKCNKMHVMQKMHDRNRTVWVGHFQCSPLLTYKPGNCAHCKRASNVLYCLRGSDWAQKQKQAWHDNLRRVSNLHF